MKRFTNLKKYNICPNCSNMDDIRIITYTEPKNSMFGLIKRFKHKNYYTCSYCGHKWESPFYTTSKQIV